MSADIFSKVMTFLDQLEQAKIDYTLARHRDEALMVLVAVPGQRWEIEFLTDGSVEIEKFRSDGEIYGEEGLAELFALYTDYEAETQVAVRSQRLS